MMAGLVDERLPINDNCRYVVDELKEAVADDDNDGERAFAVLDASKLDDIIHNDGDLQSQIDADALICGKSLAETLVLPVICAFICILR